MLRRSSSDITISVVIPAYNAERFIVMAIGSALEQRRLPDEIVVVDDGSVDNTATLVESLSCSGVPLRLIRQPNRGVSAARNAGIKAASSSHIALLDADDVWTSDHLESLERLYVETPACSLAFGDAEGVRDGEIVKESYLRSRIEISTCPREGSGYVLAQAFELLLGGSFIPLCSTLFSRDLALEFPFQPELRGAEDRLFLLRLAKVGKVVFSPRVLARVRYHSANSSANYLMMARDGFRCLELVRAEMGHGRLSEAETAALQRALVTQSEAYLYEAALGGVWSFLESVQAVARARELRISPAIRHFGRACAVSVGLASGRSPVSAATR